MEIKINKETRIKLKFYLPALATALCYQKKRWYGWKTLSWNYPSVFKESGRSCDRFEDWFLWEIEHNKNKNEKRIGKILMNDCL